MANIEIPEQLRGEAYRLPEVSEKEFWNRIPTYLKNSIVRLNDIVKHTPYSDEGIKASLSLANICIKLVELNLISIKKNEADLLKASSEELLKTLQERMKKGTVTVKREVIEIKNAEPEPISRGRFEIVNNFPVWKPNADR